MKYNEAREYIDNICLSKGSVMGLESIRELCRLLGNPQDSLKFVHIAGTNGKGSTLAFISTILKEAGYRVGRYISPTIRQYRERFQVNEKIISQNMFADIISQVKGACEDMTGRGLDHPTAFEIETATAFLFFLKKKCDIVVIETGMGGSEDATNIITTTLLSVITTISMDHMQFLGSTLSEIAGKKCGIIKPGTPVISGLQKPEAKKVIAYTCKEKKNLLKMTDTDSISCIKYGLNKQSFKLDGIKYEIKLAGVWQPENAAVAIYAAEALRDIGYDRINDDIIKKGLFHTQWQARFQVIGKKPLFIIDGAHNEDAALRLRESIDAYVPDRNKIYILGMFRDKEVDKVLEMIVKDGDMVFTCAVPNNPRAMRPLELAEVVKKYNRNVTCCDSVDEAVEFATATAKQEDVIIACGSLAYLGRILDIYNI